MVTTPTAPLLPAASSENELREAVGAHPVKEPDLYGDPSVVIVNTPPVDLRHHRAPPIPPPQEYPLYTQTTQEPSYAKPAPRRS